MTNTDVAASDGLRLAVTVAGDGPALLLIPGLGATRVVFDPVFELLSRHFRAAVYDQRGIGASDIPAGPFDTAQLGDDAAAVLDGLGMRGAAVLGASFGGLVAQQLAVRHPRLVGALLLAATGPGHGRLVVPPQPAASAALLGKGARSPEEAYRIACAALYSRHFRDENPGFIDEQVRQRAAHPIAARTFQAQLAASRAHDVWDELPSITAPTLVLHGSDDALIPLANAALLSQRIPRGRLEVFDGAGHLFFHEQPQRTVDALVAFAGG